MAAGAAYTCNQEHMVFGYMLYGIRKGFPNQGSFLKEDISGFGSVPSNLIYVEDIMSPSEIP